MKFSKRALVSMDSAKLETVFQALAACGGPEINLIHLISVATDARLQTISTMRLGSIRRNQTPDRFGNVRILAGPGTGIDTKLNRPGELRFPVWLIEALRDYAVSPRAQKRRALNGGGDGASQFLFLTKYGQPFRYPRAAGSSGTQLENRYIIHHCAVHHYIRSFVIPAARQISGDPNFAYSFHTLRIGFGTRLQDVQAGRTGTRASFGEQVMKLASIVMKDVCNEAD